MHARTRPLAWTLALLLGLCGSAHAVEHSPLFDARFNYISSPPDLVPEVVDGRWQLTNTIISDFLQEQGARYRTERLPLTSGVIVRSREGWERPSYVASTAMFVAPGVDGGSSTFSPDSLIGDDLYSVQVVANDTASLTAGSPTDTLTVEAIDRNLPAGFGLLIDSDNRFQLDAAATAGATSLSIRRMAADCTINDEDVAIAGNRFVSQQATLAPVIDGLLLMGDPDPYMNEVAASNAGRPYSLDAIASNAIGIQIRNTAIGGFEGHGIFIAAAGNSNDAAGRPYTLNNEQGVIDTVLVERCLTGATIGANDFLVNVLYASACRDYGLHTLANTNTTATIVHCYGTAGSAIEADGCLRALYLEGETSVTGIDLDGTGSQVFAMRTYNNTTRSVRIITPHGYYGSIRADHGVAGSHCIEVNQYADYTTIEHFVAVASGTCNGVQIGGGADRTLKLKKIAGTITTSGNGAKGLDIECDMAGTDIDVTVDDTDFTTEFHMDPGVEFDGCTITFRGPSAATIVWPDATTGTLGTPNVPSAISDENEVQILDY
jgi:hypothetical protein